MDSSSSSDGWQLIWEGYCNIDYEIEAYKEAGKVRVSGHVALVVLVLTASAYAKFIDVTVTNPCSVGARIVSVEAENPHSDEGAMNEPNSDTALDNDVPARAGMFFIEGETPGEVPFEGGYAIVRWDGTSW